MACVFLICIFSFLAVGQAKAITERNLNNSTAGVAGTGANQQSHNWFEDFYHDKDRQKGFRDLSLTMNTFTIGLVAIFCQIGLRTKNGRYLQQPNRFDLIELRKRIKISLKKKKEPVGSVLPWWLQFPYYLFPATLVFLALQYDLLSFIWFCCMTAFTITYVIVVLRMYTKKFAKNTQKISNLIKELEKENPYKSRCFRNELYRIVAENRNFLSSETRKKLYESEKANEIGSHLAKFFVEEIDDLENEYQPLTDDGKINLITACHIYLKKEETDDLYQNNSIRIKNWIESKKKEVPGIQIEDLYSNKPKPEDNTVIIKKKMDDYLKENRT